MWKGPWQLLQRAWRYLSQRDTTISRAREGLQGHIYDLQAHKSPDQYIQTTHEITNYIGRIHKKHTAIFMKAIEALELDMPLEPDDPDETSAWQWKGGRWKVKFKKYNEETNAYNDFLAPIQSCHGTIHCGTGGTHQVTC